MSLTIVLTLAWVIGQADASKPNIVLIVADDQAWTDFGFMGHPAIKTPHLDRLASEGAVFPHAYVPTSLCRASLATILTGQFGHQHKICCNDPPDGIDRSAMLPFLRHAPTIPRLLQASGYVSFQTGKFWEGHYSNGGFTAGMTEKGRHGDDGLIIGRKTMKPIEDFIRSAAGKPFFVWYAPMLPHEPHNPPERLLKRYRAADRHEKIAKYFAMCEWLDETVGQLLDFLERENLSKTTLVAFVVDNGWIQETGPKSTRGNFAPKSKLSPYDGGLRTPVLLRWPGKIRPGRYDDLVSTIDLAPTLLAATQTPIPKAMTGLNLLDRAIAGKPLARDAVFGELYVHTAVDIQKPSLNLTHRWVRRGHWKLIVPVDPKTRPELYDLAADPMETSDLAGEHKEQVAALKVVLNTWWRGVDE